MKTKVVFFLIILIIAGCTSSRKYLEKGNFDMATQKAIAKLRKKPDNPKELFVLTRLTSKQTNKISTVLIFCARPDSPTSGKKFLLIITR